MDSNCYRMASMENDTSNAGDKKPQIKKDFINNMETKFLDTFTIYIYAHVLYSTSYQFYVEINEKKIKRT